MIPRISLASSYLPAQFNIFQFSHEGVSRASKVDVPYALAWEFGSLLQFKTSLIHLSLLPKFQSSLCYVVRDGPFLVDF